MATSHSFINSSSIYSIFASGATEDARDKKLNEITPVFDEFTQQGKQYILLFPAINMIYPKGSSIG